MFGLKTQAALNTGVEHYDRATYKTVISDWLAATGIQMT